MKLSDAKKTSYNVGDEKITPLEAITHYNNFYEFGTDKVRPGRKRQEFPHLALDAEGGRRSRQAQDVRSRQPLQDRAARRAHLPASLRGSVVHRGAVDRLPLNALLKQVEPTSKAKYVAFESYYDPEADAAAR